MLLGAREIPSRVGTVVSVLGVLFATRPVAGAEHAARFDVGPDHVVHAAHFDVGPDHVEHPLHFDAGPKAGVSVNYDQWVVGGFARFGGLCPLICLGDLGISIHTLGGFGGNVATLRNSLRLDSLFWFGGRGTFGIYPALGGAMHSRFPVGGFAEFCERTRLAEGCSGTYFGLEVGLGLRFQSLFLEGILASGEIPRVIATAGFSFTAWEPPS